MSNFNLHQPTSADASLALNRAVDSPHFERSLALTRSDVNDRSRLSSTPGRILVCRPNGRLGNALLLTPLIQELERLFPGAEIDIVSACPAAVEIFSKYDNVRNIFTVPRLGARHPLGTLLTFLRARRITYDLIVDPCPKSWTSRFWTGAMRSRADKLGFLSDSKKKGINCAVSMDDAPKHMAQYPVHLVRQFLDTRYVRHSRSAMPCLDIRLTSAEKDFGADKVRRLVTNSDSLTPIIALFLNATGDKKVKLHFWRQLGERLQRELPGLQIIEIVAAHGEHLLSAPGYFSTNIRRIAAVIDACDWFISADCGVMHLGAATGTPTIGLFKTTDADKYAPYGSGNTAIQIDEHVPDQSIDSILRHLTAEFMKRSASARKADATLKVKNEPLAIGCQQLAG